MTSVYLTSPRAMTAKAFHRQALRHGQRFFWIWSAGAEEFVHLEAFTDHPGHKPLEITLELEPGFYVLGSGCYGIGKRWGFSVCEDTTAVRLRKPNVTCVPAAEDQLSQGRTIKSKLLERGEPRLEPFHVTRGTGE